MRRTRSSAVGALVAIIASFSVEAWAAAPPHQLAVKVIYANNVEKKVDPKLKKLAKELAPLKFSSLSLSDKALFKLDLGSSAGMELPGREWMNVHAKGMAPDKKLRVDIKVEALDFKATVAIAMGATVVVRGPPFKDGTLILAVTRVDPSAPKTE